MALSDARGHVQPEPVTVVTRKHMQMHMEDLLERRLTISEEKVDALTAEA